MIRILRKGTELVGAAIFATMFGTMLLQVFMRYVVNRPLGWTDEVSVVTYVWGIFWAGAFMVRERDHVSFDLVYTALRERDRRLFALAGTLLVGGLFAVAMPSTADYIRFMARERTSVLGIPFDLVFACFFFFLVAVAGRAARRLVRLCGRGWRDSL